MSGRATDSGSGGDGANGGRKFIKQRYRPNAPLSEDKAGGLVEEIRTALQACLISTAQSSPLPREVNFEELFRAAYSLVLHGRGQQLYAAVEELLRNHVSSLVSEGSAAAATSHCGGPLRTLHALCRSWTVYTRGVAMVNDVVMYMDRNYVPDSNKQPVKELAKSIFREEVLRHPTAMTAVKEELEKRKERKEAVAVETTRAEGSTCTCACLDSLPSVLALLGEME